MAGIPDTKPAERPPAVVAADWAVQFSLGPKYPPPHLGGSTLEIGLMMAKEKMAPKSEAPNVQPIFKPRYVFDAAIQLRNVRDKCQIEASNGSNYQLDNPRGSRRWLHAM